MLTGSSPIISSNNQYSRRKCDEVMVIPNSVPDNKHEETFFFLSGCSFTDTVDSEDNRGGRVPSFIPHYHFQPVTDIQKFICNFACEMTITYF